MLMENKSLDIFHTCACMRVHTHTHKHIPEETTSDGNITGNM